MKNLELAQKLQTVSAINLTPFRGESREIDWDALEQNIRFLLDNGVKVIVPCGNTSEFFSLTLEEAKQEIERVVRWVDGRAVVVAGIGYGVETAVELGRHAQCAGADAVMIHQPIHPYITEKGALAYYRRIMEALDIPSVVYFKDPNLSDDILKELAPMEQFIAVKYAINDLPRFARVVREIPKEHGITWICGTAEKWAPFFWHAGAVGFTSGLVNVHPEFSLGMLKALRENDAETVWRIWRRILPFEDLRAKYNSGNNVAVVKEAMNLLGMKGGLLREPLDPLGESDREELQRILTDWGLLK